MLCTECTVSEQGVEVYPRILCAGTFEQLKYSIWVNSTHGFKVKASLNVNQSFLIALASADRPPERLCF